MHGYELKEFTRDGEYVKTYSLPFQIAHFFDFIDMERLIFVSTTGDERIGIINLSSLKLEKVLPVLLLFRVLPTGFRDL